MPASDILKSAILSFGFDANDQAAVLSFLNGKIVDPTASITNETLKYYVSQDANIQKIFDTRFAGNAGLVNLKLQPLTYSEYTQREVDLRSKLKDAGFPTGFYDDKASIDKFIGSDISVNELQQRAQGAYAAVRQADPAVVAELNRLYNVSGGDLAAYYLDPTKAADILGKRPTGQDLLRQTSAAQIAAEARTQTGGAYALTATEAEALQAQGIDQGSARTAFGTIRGQGQLLTGMQGEEELSRADIIGAATGTNAAAQQRIATRARKRKAEFEQGGGFAQTNQFGISGLRTVGQ